MIEQNIFSVLSGSSTIKAITSSIYALILPTDPVLPALTYQLIAGTEQPTLSTSGMRKYRVQIDAWATTYTSASQLRDAVISTLDGYQDASISNAYKLNTIDFFEEDALQYRCMVEFYIFTTL